jgi:hypothetical protein
VKLRFEIKIFEIKILRKKSQILGKLKFQITNQHITILTKFSGLKIEDIRKQNMQQCSAKFAAPDFPT